jgi:hypothetical protein
LCQKQAIELHGIHLLVCYVSPVDWPRQLIGITQ